MARVVVGLVLQDGEQDVYSSEVPMPSRLWNLLVGSNWMRSGAAGGAGRRRLREGDVVKD